jgi:NhaP-type Na+/H+ or K+/H+ antiporter
LTSDQVLVGVSLTLTLAVGSQLVGRWLRIPALIILLPVGFVAGWLTDDINPNNLVGASFEPLVSLAVAVILYDAGLGLDLAKLRRHTRRVVIRLLALGVPLTFVVAALVAQPLLGMSHRSALMIGAILVVSGPTVVGPLLAVVRPATVCAASSPGRGH